jgi:hypothetical protein
MIRQHLTMQIGGLGSQHCFGYECKQFETIEEGTKELGQIEHLRLLNYAYRLIQASAARKKHYLLHTGPNGKLETQATEVQVSSGHFGLGRKRGRPRKVV